MKRTDSRVVLLVLGSGFCALVYQVAWFRLLRLVFGSSTPATAAVVAIFMAGIGFGSLVLGKRVDAKSNPLAFYAHLELGISIFAGLSPVAILAVQWIYIALGGTPVLGPAMASVARIVLASLVLGPPTFLMGGTLPAVVRAIQRRQDLGRRRLGVLYGANTVGAVLGAVVTTFASIELLGIRQTIWIAALLNLLVALTARAMSRCDTDSLSESAERDPGEVDPGIRAEPPTPGPSRARFVPIAAAVVGFCFFLLELVWYRMLAPLLGGSSYTFGLILSLALLGIGIGGLAYGAGVDRRRPDLIGFSLTCALEALLVVAPFAMGDRLALLAKTLRDLSALGFGGLVLSWTIVTAIVVLPAAVVAGYQFPLLVAILGSGSRDVGRQVGQTYAWNTIGAIAGSLAGGFGLIPLLTAPGAWRLVVFVLVALSLVSLVFGRHGQGRRLRWLPTATIALIALLLTSVSGPTGFWRHSPIGAGRLQLELRDPNAFEDAIRYRNRVVLWEVDGRESSVSLQAEDGLSFYLNGKSDGHARTDAPTQVMSGILGAALSPDPRRALVIGLGTGSTAGWLAEVPTMERVDVVELEPAISDVASACAPVNHDVLEHAKVDIVFGDAREVLVTTRQRYDIVFSEPSNPYRAGISSLFSRDFYRAVVERLEDDGIFIQWLQGYDVDNQVVRTALATLSSVFDSVETWSVHRSDLLLLASRKPLSHDIARIRERTEIEPYRSALDWTWGVSGAEGLYAGFIASSDLARAVLEAEIGSINTDDRPVIEFGFARNLGRGGLFRIAELRNLAAERGEDRPSGVGTELDWAAVLEMRAARDVAFGSRPEIPVGSDTSLRQRIEARRRYVEGDLGGACAAWSDQPEAPSIPIDLVMVAECLAAAGDDRALDLSDDLRRLGRAVEAAAIRARWSARHHLWSDAADSLIATFDAYRDTPWSHPPVIDRLFPLASEVVRRRRSESSRLFEAAEAPFSVRMFDVKRRALLYDIGRVDIDSDLCLRAMDQYEPLAPWDQEFLTARWSCYQKHDTGRAADALRELERFRSRQTLPLGWRLGSPTDPSRE